MLITRCYKFRLYPTAAQEAQFRQFAGCRRFVWNWGLARKREVYKATGKSIGFPELCRELTMLKKQPEMAFLAETVNATLQQTLRDLDAAFSAFFGKRSRYPRFKSKKRTPHAFRFSENCHIRPGAVQVPKVGLVKAVIHCEPVGTLKSATIKQEACGEWYVVFVAHEEAPDLPATCEHPAGLDVGLETFVTLSTGEKVAPPRFYRKAEAKLKRAGRRLSRARAGSRRRKKAKDRLARLHARTARKRGDWLHKLSARLVSEHDILCIEDLCIKGLTKTKLAKSFADAALSEFLRQIEYKAAWNGVQVVKVDRWFPSSKTCADCGHRQDLTLSERRWTCAGCGSRHDRDANAARNILAEGLRIVAVRDTETRNAQGACVRPATAGDGRRTEKPH